MTKHRRRKKRNRLAYIFDRIAASVTRAAGSPYASIVAMALIVIWAATGPIFHYSDTWQLVINTGTTIITFIMVFIIQQAQNKDTIALQLKLNELIASNERASNRLIDIEDLTEDELQTLKKFYVQLSKMAEEEDDVHASHSIDEAKKNMQFKLKSRIRQKPVKD